MEIRKILLSEIKKIVKTELIGDDSLITALSFNFNSVYQYNRLITFCNSEIFIKQAQLSPNVVAIITTPEIFKSIKEKKKSFFLSDDPQTAFYNLHNQLLTKTNFYNEYEFKKKIGKNTSIHKSVVVEEGVIIGNNVIINPNVVIRKGTIIGDNVIIKSNSVIGEDGFMVKKIGDKKRIIKHVGGVRIGNNVEIGSNCGIDKALFEGFTVIGHNTKIDNLVQIAHNCTIGLDCVICADVQISGTTLIGNYSYIAPSVTIRNELIIGEKVFIGQGAVVTKNIPSGEKWIGVPAKPFNIFLSEK